MRYALLSAIFAASSASLAMAQETKSYDNADFTALHTSAGVSVTFEAAPEYSVVAEFRKGSPDNLKVKQSGDTLSLSLKSGLGSKGLDIHVHVTAPDLEELEASSGSSLSASGISAEAFEIEASSGASIHASGTCTDIEIEASSGASINAEDLQCETADVDASSGASVRTYASVSAKSDPSSGASVRISGNPAEQKAKKSWSGGTTRFD